MIGKVGKTIFIKVNESTESTGGGRDARRAETLYPMPQISIYVRVRVYQGHPYSLNQIKSNQIKSKVDGLID